MKSTTALWAAGAIGGAILAGLLVSWLMYPSSIMPNAAVVPALRGTATDQAVNELAAIGLRGRLAGELADPLTPVGTISWQSPAPGTTLPESSIVRLGVSTGAPRVVMPELVDMDLPSALRVIAAAGLRIGRVDSVFSSTAAGVLLGSRPDGRQPIRAGSRVDVIVSQGPRSPQ